MTADYFTMEQAMTGIVRIDDEEDDLVELAFRHVTNQGYPEGCSNVRKRMIRRKAKKFEVVGGGLFHKHKIKGKVSNFRLF